MLIVDDHPIVRRGLRHIVAEQSDMSVTADTGNAREALRLASTGQFDVVVLDISMPDVSGVELLSQLRSQQPDLPVLMLSTHPESELAIRALKAGAAGYLNKDMAPDELVTAIRRVVSGKKYVSETLAELLADSVASGDAPPHASLSDREYQVMLLISSGRTVAEIASELSLSVKTVSTYRARILEKMKMRNNAELMHYAIRNGIVAPDV